MKQKEIGQNTVFNTLKSIFSIIYPLITFPYISRVLMAENVGKINFGNSVISYFSLVASLGVTTYAIRQCSLVKNDKEKLEKNASEIFSINVFSTLLSYAALIVTLVCAKELDSYKTLITIQSIAICFTTLGADWLNTAVEDFKFIALRTIGVQIASILLMLVFIKTPDDYLKYAGLCVLASSGANVINIFYRKKICHIRFTLRLNLKKHLPSILLLFSLLLSQTLYCNSDITMLGLMKGDYEVGLYSTSVNIYNIVNSIVASVAWVVMPQLSVGFAAKDYTEINRLLKYSLNFIVVLGLPCLVGLNMITEELIYVLAGAEYVDASLSLHILTVSLLFSFIGGWIGNMMMLPAGKEKLFLISTIVSAVSNVMLNLLLIPKYGLNAAAATTTLAELIGIVIQVPFVDRQIKITDLREVLKAPIIGSAGILLVGTVGKYLLHSAFSTVAFTVGGGVVIYICVLVALKNEFFDTIIKSTLPQIRRR